jgi:hypothetical protein
MLESIVFEKLFHEDQPMGGGVTGICFARGVVAAKARRDLEIKKNEPTITAAMAAAGRTNRFSIFAS